MLIFIQAKGVKSETPTISTGKIGGGKPAEKLDKFGDTLLRVSESRSATTMAIFEKQSAAQREAAEIKRQTDIKIERMCLESQEHMSMKRFEFDLEMARLKYGQGQGQGPSTSGSYPSSSVAPSEINYPSDYEYNSGGNYLFGN